MWKNEANTRINSNSNETVRERIDMIYLFEATSKYGAGSNNYPYSWYSTGCSSITPFFVSLVFSESRQTFPVYNLLPNPLKVILPQQVPSSRDI